MKHQNQKSHEEHQPIRFKQFIADPQEIRRTAKRLSLQRLITETHEEIHHWADKEPDKAHLATAREIQEGTGFLVGMTYAGGLFCDFGLLFEIDNTMPYDDAQHAMIALSEECAQWLFANKYRGALCECCAKKAASN
jgi:hypothetical protein